MCVRIIRRKKERESERVIINYVGFVIRVIRYVT